MSRDPPFITFLKEAAIILTIVFILSLILFSVLGIPEVKP